ASSTPAGFILKNQNGDVIDAVAANGFAFDGSEGEVASDWFGNPGPFCSGSAGIMRTNFTDHNSAADWIASDSSHFQTIGAHGYLLDSSFTAPVINWSSPTLGNFV